MKHRVKGVTSVALAVAMLATSVFSGGGAAFVQADDSIQIETSAAENNETEGTSEAPEILVQDDGISISGDTEGIAIQDAEVLTGATVAVQEEEIAVDGSRLLSVSAFNHSDADSKFRLYFWNGKLPEERESWNFSDPSLDLYVISDEGKLTGELTVNNTVQDADLHFVEDKKGDTVTASYLLADLPAGSNLAFTVRVNADTACDVAAITAVDQALFEGVSLSWTEDDIVIESETETESIVIEPETNDIVIEDSIVIEGGETETVSEAESAADISDIQVTDDTNDAAEDEPAETETGSVVETEMDRETGTVIDTETEPDISVSPETEGVDIETTDSINDGSDDNQAEPESIDSIETDDTNPEMADEQNVSDTDAETESEMSIETETGVLEQETSEQTEEAGSEAVSEENESEVSDTETETEDTESDTETVAVLEEETDAPESEAEEHFLEFVDGADELNAADFVSMRLVVLAENPETVIDPEHMIANYDTIYLLQYDSVAQAMNAYAYYAVNAQAVEADKILTTATNEVVNDIDNADDVVENAPVVDNMTVEENPVATLAEEVDSVPAKNTSNVIALIDTGASQSVNVIDRVSLIDDVLNGGTHGDDMVKFIISQNPDAKILSIRALGNDGWGSVSAVVSAIEYAINSNVNIINLSMYSEKTLAMSVLEAQIQKAVDAGIIVVGAAGNDGKDVANYVPGSIDSVWTIGAVSEQGGRQLDSNFGDLVDYYVVGKSTSEAAAKFSGYISRNGIYAASEDASGLIFRECNEGEIIEEPEITDETIYDPLVENYVKEHANPAYVGEGTLKLVNLMDVDATIAAEEDLNPGETIDTLMANDTGFRFLTQQTGIVPVYQLDENSDYLVAWVDVMHGQGRIVDRQVARNDTTGEAMSGSILEDSGLMYIPKSLYYGEDGNYYLEYIQTQILYAISGFDINSSWDANTMAVTENTDGSIDRNVNGGNILLQGMSVQVGKHMDLNTMLVTVNGYPIEGDLYAYDPDAGILTLGFSSAVVQSVWVKAEKSADAPDVEPGLRAAYGAPVVSGVPAGYDFDSMQAVCADIATADFAKMVRGYEIADTYATMIYPEGSQNHSGLNAGGTCVYAYRGSHDYGSYSPALVSFILTGAGSNNSVILQDAKVYAAPTDAIYPFALKIQSIDDANIDFSGFDNDLHLILECTHVHDPSACATKVNTSAWRTAKVWLRCVYSDLSCSKPYAVFAVYTGHCAGQHGIGLFKVYIKPDEPQTTLKITKRITNAEYASESDRIQLKTEFRLYKDKNCTQLYTKDGFNGIIPINGNESMYKYVTSVKGIEPGTYYLKETGRCVGCIHLQTIFEVKIEEGKTTSTFKAVNTTNTHTKDKVYSYISNVPFYGRFEIFKRDTNTKEPLAGAVFRVEYYSKAKSETHNKADLVWYFKSGDGENHTVKGYCNYTEPYFLESWTNPENGKTYTSHDPITKTNGLWYLPLSHVYITEVQAPEGYMRDTETHHLNLYIDPDVNMENGLYVKAEYPTKSLTIDNTPYGKLRIRKKSSDSSYTGSLAGAEFKVYTDEACTKVAKDYKGNTVGTLTTVESGYTSTVVVPLGTYYVKETKAPENFTLCQEDEGYGVGIHKVEATEAGKLVVCTCKDAYTPPKVKITKTSTANDEILGLSSYSKKGAEFSIYEDKACTQLVTLYEDAAHTKSVTVLKTDANGETGEYILPCTENGTHTYWVKETKAPAGHSLNSTPKSFTVTLPDDSDKTKEVEISNDPVFPTVDALVEKLDMKGNPVDSRVNGPVIFECKFYDAKSVDAGKLMKTWYLWSDEYGEVYLDEDHKVIGRNEYSSDSFYTWGGDIVIPRGYFTIQEIAAPPEYIIDETVYEWDTTEKKMGVKRIYNDLKPCKLKLRKLDSDGKTPLAGVTFNLEFLKASVHDTTLKKDYSRLLEEGKSISYTTNSSGEVVFENLDQGQYRITEVKTADGRSLLAEPIEVTLPLAMTQDEVNSYGNVDVSKGELYDGKYYFMEMTFEVTNNFNFKIPMTGSTGTWKYGFVGIAMIAALGTGCMVYGNRRRRRRKA